MCVKTDEQLKSNKQIELTSDLSTILIHTETETGIQEVYKCPSNSPNHYHLRNLVSSVLSDIVCGNEDLII